MFEQWKQDWSWDSQVSQEVKGALAQHVAVVRLKKLRLPVSPALMNGHA